MPLRPVPRVRLRQLTRWIEEKNTVNTLRVHLRDYAAARQINLNIGEALV